jgi:tRNA threonylcarbamoyladenosine biosynthesis protein TsaB
VEYKLAVRALAVDTTSPHGSLAVAEAGEIVAEARVVSEAGHSRWLLGAVDALLSGLGLTAGEIDLFAVTTGPGSFTGLRVGLGSVQGLALAARRPCLGVSTLDVVADGVRGAAAAAVALLDARRGEVFWAVYGRDGALVGERQVGSLEMALAAAPRGSAFAGDAVAAHRQAIERAVEGAQFPETSGFLASGLARLATARAGEAGPAAELRPLYLRGVAIRPSRA